MLILGEYTWFDQWREEPSGARSDEYMAFKTSFATRDQEMLLRFYPQLKDKMDFIDVSTPLSIEHYLASPDGAAVGLEPSPLRYNGDWSIMKHLDSITPIPGLYLSGQDTLICGVVMAQAAGLATAMRLVGFINSIKIILQCIFHWPK